MVKGAIKQVLMSIAWQCLGLISQVIIIGCVARAIAATYYGTISSKQLLIYICVALFAVFARLVFDRLYSEACFTVGVDVKKTVREEIYSKLLRLASGYRQYVSIEQLAKLMGDGAEQLEFYYGRLIGQLAYAILAPLILFLILSSYNLNTALMLFIAVPLIPIANLLVVRILREFLSKYFKISNSLTDTFINKLHGMTTLKLYNADQKVGEELDQEADNYRRISMKLLSERLYSLLAMDLISYIGIGLGLAITINQFVLGYMKLDQAIMFLLLSTEFILPMRLFSSYFQEGMDGKKTAEEIMDFLAIKEPAGGKQLIEDGPYDIGFRNVSYSSNDKELLNNLTFNIHQGKITSIVELSGSGKSTLAYLLRRQLKGYNGSILINGKELKSINERSLMSIITCVSATSFIFQGTVRDNLLLANSKASDKKLLGILKLMNLLDELNPLGGLNFILNEGGTNISAGQRQRLLVGRALLKNTPIFLFDEVTSNIDAESEEHIMRVIRRLSKEMGKTIILISHRLANVAASDQIYVLENGTINEYGTHQQLLEKNGGYAALFNAQHALESYAGGGMS